MDQNLCIAKIAEKFDLYPYYLSKLYKTNCGEGIGDFINKIRIEKAVEIILQSDMNLEDISSKVGFSNVRTFSRTFKKIKGITPGKYRNLNNSK
jgi:YesN/AraC family two-component response regulator